MACNEATLTVVPYTSMVPMSYTAMATKVTQIVTAFSVN